MSNTKTSEEIVEKYHIITIGKFSGNLESVKNRLEKLGVYVILFPFSYSEIVAIVFPSKADQQSFIVNESAGGIYQTEIFLEDNVLHYLSGQSAPVSTEQVAQALGITPKLAKNALRWLAKCGMVRISPTKPRGSLTTYSWQKTQGGKIVPTLLANKQILANEMHVITNAKTAITRQRHILKSQYRSR